LPHEEDNLRAALAVAFEQDDVPGAVRIALALAPFWWEHGLFVEARSALDHIIARADQLETALLGIVLGWGAEWAWLQSDYLRTSELARSALAICRSMGDDAGTAANLYRLGRVATALDPVAAQPLLQEALALNQQLKNDRDAAWALLGLAYATTMLNDLDSVDRYVDQAWDLLARLDDPKRGGLSVSLEQARAWIAFMRGDLAFATAELERSLVECREEAFEFGACNALRLLGRVARKRGDLEHAASLQLEALRLAQKQGALRRECYCLVELANLACALGQTRQAARLLGAESSLRHHLGHVPTPDERETLSDTRSAVIDAIGEPEFERARLAGESLDWSGRLDVASSILKSPTA
jgi:non-specific serine/threonine protein kinase